MAKDMIYYAAKIREANDPLGILLNMDYLTDLLDVELNKQRCLNKNDRKTQMERIKLRQNFNGTPNSVQMHRLWDSLSERNSNSPSEVER